MASAAATSDVSDGPVLLLINKRIRNLKKKLNRIAQLEESIAQGKSAVKNKEQEELLKSKPSIVAAVDELEKLRQPLSVAVDEEISLAVKNSQAGTSESNDKEVDSDNGGETGTASATATATATATTAATATQTLGNEGGEGNEVAQSVELVEDLLKLIYFGNMFDVKSKSDFESIIFARTHERNCCLTYDYVTDDEAAVVLSESDLDLISMMSSLLISRPVASSFSHQNALQSCIEHAKLWLEKSEQPIDANSNVTYAALREKLTKIIGSDFFRITPEMKPTADVAAEAAGNYGFQVPVQIESTVTSHEQAEEDASDLQRTEAHEDQTSPAEDSPEHEPEAEHSPETEVQADQHDSKAVGTDHKDQYVPRRSYHNRGGGRSNGNGSRSGGRGYGGGRGGRSGGRGGPYQNGRNQYYEQAGNYYPRNYYGGRGRGGRGGGSNGGGGNGYNHHAAGVEAAS